MWNRLNKGIVNSLAVAGGINELVTNLRTSFEIEIVKIMLKSFPWFLRTVWVKLFIRRQLTVDEAKIGLSGL